MSSSSRRVDSRDWAALVLGVLAALLLCPWTIGLIQFTWKLSAVNDKHRVHVWWLWVGTLWMIWGMIAVIIAGKMRSEEWMGQFGWAAPYVALVAWLAFAVPFVLKDFARDWDDKLQLYPYCRAFRDVCFVLGWKQVCRAAHHTFRWGPQHD